MYTTVEILGFAREIAWLPWVVQYFFLIGLSIAAFFISLPGLVWHHPKWRDVSWHALLAALICGFTAPMALLADLHQPGRFLNFYLHPNPGSWMAWGSFFIPLYVSCLLFYAWLCLRPQLAAVAERRGCLAGFYRALAYGGRHDLNAIRAAALATALGAVVMLLYSSMEVIVVAARPLWHTSLLPLLFFVTAFAGSLGLTGLFEAAAGRYASAPLLNLWLARSQCLVLMLLAAWLILGVTGASAPAAETLAAIGTSIGWRLTGAWLFLSVIFTAWLAFTYPQSLLLPALFALHGAWLVRWVVFIGGQGLPKMGAAFAYYSLTPASLLGIGGTVGLCIAFYIILTSLIPWNDAANLGSCS
jgi:tetrathionate reductase subunit C